MTQETMTADATLAAAGIIKNHYTKETPEGPKRYIIMETQNPFGEREALFIKLTGNYELNDFPIGERFIIPVLTFVSREGRLFLRANPERAAQKLTG